MKIEIPHLDYTVTIKDIKKAKGAIKDFLSKSDGITYACAHKEDSKNSVIYISIPLKRNQWSTLGHEIVHVLQFICEEKDMDFIKEQEHMAYLFQYIFNGATGYKYY